MSSVAHQSRISPDVRARVLRGLKLFQERGHEIERAPRPASFYIPSCSGEERYEASLGIDDDAPSCSCPDFRRRQQACKHVYCLEIWTAHRNRQRARGRGPRSSKGEVAAVAARLDNLAA